jgi:hypothetical protein
MSRTPDLSNSITMHPHPFHLHYPNRSESRSGNHTPIQSNSSTKPGTSTAFEPAPPAAEENDPISRHPTNAMSDLEDQRPPNYIRENDPYQLSASYKNASELQDIVANTSRKRDGCGPIKFNRDAYKARKLQKFYESQNENIERMLKPVEDHRAEAKHEAGEDHLKFQIAVYGSFAANVMLAGLQLYGAISSGSLSLFTTMADAIFDPMSNVTLIVSNRAVKHVDPNRFPSGKARLETVGNIVFCFLMTAVSFILIAFSIRELIEGSDDKTKSFHLPSVIAVAVAFTTKLSLFLGSERQILPNQYSLARSPKRLIYQRLRYPDIRRWIQAQVVDRSYGRYHSLLLGLNHLVAYRIQRVPPPCWRHCFGRDPTTHHVRLLNALSRHRGHRHS